MKLVDRDRVDGTTVTIGRRVSYKAGKQRTSRRYAAEYRDEDGKQVCETLGTTSRTQARRRALEIQQRLEAGVERVREAAIGVEHLADRYFAAVKTKDLAPKTEWKYRTDLEKLKTYCAEEDVRLARRFSEDDLYGFRQWLRNKGYADKTVQGAVVLAKQVFKWAWRQGLLRDYRLAAASLPKAKAAPQPCFRSDQVDSLIAAGEGEEPAAFALMGYAGLRIGEVEQLQWEDILHADGRPSMIHVRRGGSRDTTKDKDARFVPVFPTIARLLEPMKKSAGSVFHRIAERTLLKRLKELCATCGFENPDQYKLHSFRHHFASLCANNNVAYRKVLAWLGHSSSEMLDLYYHLHDDDSKQAMRALAACTQHALPAADGPSPTEGALRATGQSTIEKLAQVPEARELIETLVQVSERAGFSARPRPRCTETPSIERKSLLHRS